MGGCHVSGLINVIYFSPWERPSRLDAPGEYLKTHLSNLVQKQPSLTHLSGRNDPYHPDSKGQTEFLPSQTELGQAFLVLKTGQNPPQFSRTALPQTRTCGERPKNNPATSPPSTHSHNAAHQGSGCGVPDLHEPVPRAAAGDALAVRGEIDRCHPVRVPRQRVHLPPTHPHLRRPEAKPAWNDCCKHSNHLTTLHALPQNCAPRLRSWCPRS